jgi:FAD/FMN-containing dehydrogenase
MKNVKGITIDSSKSTAIVETGNRLGAIATALNDAGRAIPHGTCPTVGIGGLSGKFVHLHTYHPLKIIELAQGGFGFTSRLWGLTIDAIRSINVVLANGTMVTASNEDNVDIFWVSLIPARRAFVLMR